MTSSSSSSSSSTSLWSLIIDLRILFLLNSFFLLCSWLLYLKAIIINGRRLRFFRWNDFLFFILFLFFFWFSFIEFLLCIFFFILKHFIQCRLLAWVCWRNILYLYCGFWPLFQAKTIFLFVLWEISIVTNLSTQEIFFQILVCLLLLLFIITIVYK